MAVIDKISMFNLLVQNVAHMKSFYTDKLSFEVVKEYEKEGNHWVTIVPPGGGTAITITNCYEDMKPAKMKMYLSTPEIEEAYKELKTKGVKLNTKISDDPWGKWFSFDDPEGNHWLIMQS